MIEIHYGKYIRNDADEQTKPEVGDKTETSGETVERKAGRRETQATEKIQKMLVEAVRQCKELLFNSTFTLE